MSCYLPVPRLWQHQTHREACPWMFHYQQAIRFKKKLAEQKSQKSGKELSKATLHPTLIRYSGTGAHE